MVLITQPHSLPVDGLNEYSIIILLARVDESIPVETVKNLFECGAEVSVSVLTKQADDMELAFSIGSLVGENGGTDNVTISLDSVPAKDLLKRMGMDGALLSTQKRATTKKKSAARTSRTKSGVVKTEKVTVTAQPAREKAAAGSKTAARAKFQPAFLKILKECTVSKEYAGSIAKAVQESAESISYELRLQLNVMDRAVSADIYAKTKDRYNELKELV